MTAHVHAEKIKVKADNMNLIMFEQSKGGDTYGKWVECNKDTLPKNSEFCYYFLCLPQHNKSGQCLHWLNGGKTQLEYTHASYPVWNDIDNDATDWSTGHVFMDESLKIRIKPRKEKRYLMVNKNGACTNHFSTKERALDCIAPADNRWQLVEIEVDV